MATRLRSREDVGFSILHGGYADGRLLASSLEELPAIRRHIFLREAKLYRGHFERSDAPKVLIRDGFIQQKKNAHYPESDHFSDLHVTYRSEGMDGFGDYLTVGADYSESGGPAYAVAIHLTYLDAEGDMQTHHFVSDRTDSPADPGGKFLEALSKLVAEATRSGSEILRTGACEEFIDLFAREYYPGLGYVKKLSMQHHLELMASVENGEPRA